MATQPVLFRQEAIDFFGVSATAGARSYRCAAVVQHDPQLDLAGLVVVILCFLSMHNMRARKRSAAI